MLRERKQLEKGEKSRERKQERRHRTKRELQKKRKKRKRAENMERERIFTKEESRRGEKKHQESYIHKI